MQPTAIQATSAPCRDAAYAGQRGFTLIEILITVGLTMVALAGLMSLNVAITRGNQLASQTAEAIAMAKSVMEEIRSLPASEINTTNGAYVEPELRDGRNTSFVVRATYTPVTLAVGDPPNTTFRVRVSVAWLENAERLAAGAEASDILQFGPGSTASGCDPSVGCENFHSVSLEVLRSVREGI